MRHSRKVLAKLGREVISRYPDIATPILDRMNDRREHDLSKIPDHFNSYCQAIGANPESIKGPVYKSSITELQKVFVSAMTIIYCGKWGLTKTLAGTLGQVPPLTSRWIGEAKARYQKDKPFTEKVNDILNKLNPLLLSNTNGHDQ